MDKRKYFFQIPSIEPQLLNEFPCLPKSYISKLMEEIPGLDNIKTLLKTEMTDINDINSPNWVTNYFKVFPCVNQFRCKSPLCVYYHSSSEKRRSPKHYDYSPELCPAAGNCLQFNLCKKAHNTLEILYHPNIYQSAHCPYMLSHFGCPCSFLCPFIHCNSLEDQVLEEFKKVLKERDDLENVSNGVESHLKEKLEEMGIANFKIYCKCTLKVEYIRIPCGHTACKNCYTTETCIICSTKGKAILITR